MSINLNSTDWFEQRHIGPNAIEQKSMLDFIGIDSLDSLINETVPSSIRIEKPLQLPAPLSEYQYLQDLTCIAEKNQTFRSYIGLGYYGTITPSVIRRNVLENPGWYTQYTPYQAEIAQGRLEALLNFQTMISDLTGMPVANASLLDEGTAAAEAMNMFFHNRARKDNSCNKILISNQCFPQSIDVMKTRAIPLGIEIVVADVQNTALDESFFAVMLQYPAKDGQVTDYSSICEKANSLSIFTIVAADILSLALLTPPGEWGADCVVGNSQRFGVPMGFGGPHAAFFATKEDFKRVIPGRIIGVSVDRNNQRALRMALQTREQHIRREKATSNICTAQALLAIMASMYAVYHGANGIHAIAERVHANAISLANGLKSMDFTLKHNAFFDTVCVLTNNTEQIRNIAEQNKINLNYHVSGEVSIALDETVTPYEVNSILHVFATAAGKTFSPVTDAFNGPHAIPQNCVRKSLYLTHPVFNSSHSETRMLRYIKSLEEKDLSLNRSMIALGSCTMKLNATTELEPITWPQFANIHPFVPVQQAQGYMQIIDELSAWLSEITGFDACSLQPNSGAQGEYAGLMVIKAYHESRGDAHRNVILIPSSAHGTNPASAAMTGSKIVIVACDSEGNIDVEDLKAKAEQNSSNLSGLMVTYPSTHGVFESSIREVCNIIHQHSGQVYMDGANMNAQVGLTSPGMIGADVCHLNLHKTFAIPHGGGGPGMGPICVKSHLAPFLPGNVLIPTGGEKAIHGISAAPYGSALILLISYAYIKMLGAQGVTNATKIAILNANYIKAKLEKEYNVLYVGKEHGRVAHELILDFRPFKMAIGLEVEDVAKRLMDYGFHAPTVSFPVAGTIMIEPTESEDIAELDRFCEAMLSIREEIREIELGNADKNNNLLKNAPHTLEECIDTNWSFPYSREKAAFPLPYVSKSKFWPSVARVNNSHGDRNLICTCEPIEAYMEKVESLA